MRATLMSVVFLVAGCCCQQSKPVGPPEQSYDWFYQRSSRLEGNLQSMKELQVRMFKLKEVYGSKTFEQWHEDDARDYRRWSDALVELRREYMKLASEYNVEMKRIHFRYCNQDGVPHGHKTLPRSYRSLLTNG